jgi:rfaE bifunctional protein nucleotidyltransferase chain/domain
MNGTIYNDAEKLAAELAGERAGGAAVVLANGCFDILHVGHVRYIREAASLGDILVVAVNDDSSTAELKGSGRPITPQDERAEIIAGIKGVDYVLIFGGKTVDHVIRMLKPDIHAKGTDYTVETVPELETSKAIGCRTVIVGDPKDHASRDIIKKLRG